MLLSSSCYGLQSMLNVCVGFGSRWDILFNPAKTVTFGGNSPKQFSFVIGDKQLSWCTKLKYLGCIFVDGSCEIDISPSVGKFYAQFSNIMAVLGKYNSEMAAVHLTNSCCVPSLLYACEIWSLRKSSAHSVRVALSYCVDSAAHGNTFSLYAINRLYIMDTCRPRHNIFLPHMVHMW